MGWRLYLRILSVALLVLFLPVAGIVSLRSFERELLAAEERAMTAQATTLAAGLASVATLDAGAARARLRELPRPLTGRLRIFGGDGALLADTAGATVAGSDRGAASGGTAEPALYRVGTFLWRVTAPLRSSGGRVPSSDDRIALARALAGGYGALTRLSEDGTGTVLTVAVPIHAGGEIRGAVAISRTTDTVLAALRRLRLDLFRVVVLSTLATALIAWLLARGVVAPLLRLRDAADRALRHPPEGSVTIPETGRRDEIGDLARALAALQDRLDRRLGELEAFASDVAHEVRNPLATIRTAAALVPESSTPAERDRLLDSIGDEVRRVDRVVTALQELARLDGMRGEGAGGTADLAAIARSALSGAPAARVRFEGPTSVRIAMAEEPVARVVANLLDNALSFSGESGNVRVAVVEKAGEAELVVSDDGPGVPEEHRRKIFDRFFSWRPGEGSVRHLGLGLAIARALVERAGGSISLDPTSPDGRGAVFRVRWPAPPA